MSMVIKNALIFDAYTWGEKKDIKIDGGKITMIGENISADEEIDLNGYSIMPGFFDAHMHLVSGSEPFSDESLKEWALSGVLTVRDMGFGGKQTLEEFVEWINSINKNPETAQVVTAGRFITAPNGYGHIMGGHENGIAVRGAREAREAVLKMKKLGCHGIKTAADMEHFDSETPVLSTEEFKALIDEAKKNNMWIGAHIQHTEYMKARF